MFAIVDVIKLCFDSISFARLIFQVHSISVRQYSFASLSVCLYVCELHKSYGNHEKSLANRLNVFWA